MFFFWGGGMALQSGTGDFSPCPAGGPEDGGLYDLAFSSSIVQWSFLRALETSKWGRLFQNRLCTPSWCDVSQPCCEESNWSKITLLAFRCTNTGWIYFLFHSAKRTRTKDCCKLPRVPAIARWAVYKFMQRWAINAESWENLFSTLWRLTNGFCLFSCVVLPCRCHWIS